MEKEIYWLLSSLENRNMLLVILPRQDTSETLPFLSDTF